jgi:hypothetical protein
VQGLLGDKNSKAKDINEVGQALDAISDPKAHDFVKSGALGQICVVCKCLSNAHTRKTQLIAPMVGPSIIEPLRSNSEYSSLNRDSSGSINSNQRLDEMISRMQQEIMQDYRN